MNDFLKKCLKYFFQDNYTVYVLPNILSLVPYLIPYYSISCFYHQIRLVLCVHQNFILSKMFSTIDTNWLGPMNEWSCFTLEWIDLLVDGIISWVSIDPKCEWIKNVWKERFPTRNQKRSGKGIIGGATTWTLENLTKNIFKKHWYFNLRQS